MNFRYLFVVISLLTACVFPNLALADESQVVKDYKARKGQVLFTLPAPVLVIIILITLISVGLSRPAYADIDSINLDVNVNVKLAPYADIALENPAYVVLSLQNIGHQISHPKSVNILSPQSIQIGRHKLTYLKKTGHKYFYTAYLALGQDISIPVEIDTKNLINGSVQLRLYAPLPVPEFLRQEISEKILLKLTVLGGLEIQDQLISYYSEKMKSGSIDSPIGISRFFESIAFDSYNQFGFCGRKNAPDVGSSETPLVVILILLFIPAVLIFGEEALLFIRKRRAQ